MLFIVDNRLPAAIIAATIAAGAAALDVSYDKRTPATHRAWGDGEHVREQMEVAAAQICKALYGGEERSRLHDNFKMTLYLAPERGGNPAFASGRRITWKVGENPKGGMDRCPGILVHEMTHVLDMKSDSVFTEAMADWVRYYRVCATPSGVLDRRYGALRGARHYGKYADGANFLDFMTQNYGEGTIYKILQGYAKHGGKAWEEVFGKTLDGLVAEWRQMETIHDPVFMWTYNATPEGKVRWDGKFSALRGVRATADDVKSGAWLDGATSGTVAKLDDGCITLAMHGRFPSSGKVVIASLGATKGGNGKAMLLATAKKTDTLAVHVVASVPGKGCRIVSSTTFNVPALASSAHSIVLSVKDGENAAVVVDGKPKAAVDMKSKCAGCSFSPAFAIGGMHGGFGVSDFAEPRGNGKEGLLLDDMRVFNRTFRSRETKAYADVFGPDYCAGEAVWAEWCGKPGAAIDDIASWHCCNSLGERVRVLPSKATEVHISGKKPPDVPPAAKFQCKSFTIEGFVAADEMDVDLRGVRVVDVADNTRLVTRNGRRMAVHALRGKRLRLDGTLAVTGGMKLAGNLELKGASVLRLPDDPEMAQVKSISIAGEGTVALVPGVPAKRGRFQKLLRVAEMPEDLTRFRLSPSGKPEEASFKPATGGKALGATPK